MRMGKLSIIFYLLFQSASLWASGYEILINHQGYDLKITLDFHHYQTLQKVRRALVTSEVLSSLSPNVRSVTNKGPLTGYDSLMVVKSFGVRSELLSVCEENFGEKSWRRSCRLKTGQLDSGKYMLWKTDEVHCMQRDEEHVSCTFAIKGKTKPLKVLGFTLLSDKAFAVKAKYQALNNFFKIFYYVMDDGISTKNSLRAFETSEIKRELDDFEKEAISQLKSASFYKRNFQLKGSR